MPRIDIFISSKMQELAAEREMLSELIPTLSQGVLQVHPWIFEEDAPAADKTIREVYLDALKQSGLYIGLFWKEYGEWTIDEFDRATEWNIPRHIYVKDVDGKKRDPKLEKFLNDNQQVTSGTTHKWFKTLDELRDAVKASIETWLKEAYRGRPGGSSASRITDPDDVPHQPRKLIGREKQQTDVRALLDDKRQVLVQGLGGTGKTALAATLAADWVEDGQGDVIWLLAGNSDATALYDALSHPFGAQKEVAVAEGDEKRQLIRQMLRISGASLLVLDDAWEGAALHEFLEAIPRKMALLVTSRQRYGLEEIVALPDLTDGKALELLRYHARDYAADDTQAGELCTKLGNLPFALEIAGKTMKMNTWAAVELSQKIAVTPHDMSVPLEFRGEDRENVAALLETSIYALDEELRKIFLTFGAFFAPAMTVEMMGLYMDDAGVRREAPDVDKSLATLVQHGLAERIPETDTTIAHYRIHDLTYSYARAQAKPEQRNRAVIACLNYTERYNQPSPENFAALRPELDNFMGAAGWAMEQGHYDDVERFVRNLYTSGSEVLDYCGYYTRAVGLLQQAAEAAGKQGNKADRGVHLGHLGIAYSNLGQYDRSIEYHEQSLTIKRETGDKRGQSNSLGNLGSAYYGLGQYERAIEYYQQLFTIACEIGDKRGEGNGRSGLGLIYYSLGQYESAIEHYQQALEISREIGDRRGEGAFFGNLGSAYYSLGQYQRAIKYHEQALEISREIGDRRREGVGLGNLGLAYDVLGQYERAIEYHTQALEISREIGDRRGEGDELGNLGLTYTKLGQYERAIEYHTQALEISREIGDRRGEGSWLGNQGVVYRNLGQYERAIEYYEQSLAISRKIGDQHGEGIRLGNLGSAYHSLGQYQRAIEYHQQSLTIKCEIGDKHGQASSLGNLGVAYFSLEQYERSIDFFGQARAIFEALGLGHMVEMVDGNIARAKAEKGE